MALRRPLARHECAVFGRPEALPRSNLQIVQRNILTIRSSRACYRPRALEKRRPQQGERLALTIKINEPPKSANFRFLAKNVQAAIDQTGRYAQGFDATGIELPWRRGNLVSRELKDQLFSRNSTCAICNGRIGDVDDAAVDHIKQYWTGGRTVEENARLTHRYCNWSRSRMDEVPTSIAV
jgi:hypothetical protein